MTKPLGQQSFEKDAAALRSTLPGEWVLLDSQTLTGSAVSVTFSSIPGDYRTLVLLASTRTDRAAEDDSVMWRANADAGNNYDTSFAYFDGAAGHGSGATRAASWAYAGVSEGASSRASCYAPTLCYWFQYASASIEKYSSTAHTFRMGDVSADTDIYMFLMNGRWRSTSAITSLNLLPNVGPNFVSGCVFTLYGIL